jgi:hypothetical protein
MQQQFDMGAPQQCGGHTFCTGAAQKALEVNASNSQQNSLFDLTRTYPSWWCAMAWAINRLWL